MDEKNFLNDIKKDSYNLSVLWMIEIATAVIVLLLNSPTSILDYLWLIIQFVFIGGALFFIFCLLKTAIEAFAEKCNGKISEYAFRRILALLPMIVMMIFAFYRMCKNG